MKPRPIFFFKEGIKFRLSDQEKVKKWIIRMTGKEGSGVENINFIFCNDVYLMAINKKYLGHDYFTDIVTFDNSSTKNKISGDIFISIDRVQENSETYQTSFKDELHRVMAHGVLHLLGYDDKNEKKKSAMRKREDAWLSGRKF